MNERSIPACTSQSPSVTQSSWRRRVPPPASAVLIGIGPGRQNSSSREDASTLNFGGKRVPHLGRSTRARLQVFREFICRVREQVPGLRVGSSNLLVDSRIDKLRRAVRLCLFDHGVQRECLNLKTVLPVTSDVAMDARRADRSDEGRWVAASRVYSSTIDSHFNGLPEMVRSKAKSQHQT